MNITDRFIKFGTYFFFTAIILLIIATFGMPDFLESASRLKKESSPRLMVKPLPPDVNRSLETIKQQCPLRGATTGLEGF